VIVRFITCSKIDFSETSTHEPTKSTKRRGGTRRTKYGSDGGADFKGNKENIQEEHAQKQSGEEGGSQQSQPVSG
jgi:hypothetical protein